ncbi:hypothetical protein Tco_0401004 [Tanacetum coccineum]
MTFTSFSTTTSESHVEEEEDHWRKRIEQWLKAQEDGESSSDVLDNDHQQQEHYLPVFLGRSSSSSNSGEPYLVNNGATSSGSSFMNVDNNGEFANNTPIGEKIDKIERQIRKGKLRLLDNDGNPLVPMGIVKSDSKVEVVFDEIANLRISTSGKDGSDKGYGTNSLLEQCIDSYSDNDDYDSYDDDMYENHDLSEHLQSICDDLDITTRGRKKK